MSQSQLADDVWRDMSRFVLDNKDRLAQMVEASGAHSTDLEEPEDAAALCAKTHAAADRWEPVAQRLWEEGHWTSGPNAGWRK